MNVSDIIFIIIVLAGMLMSVFLKKLTVAAALTGGLLSACIYGGSGYTGIMILAAFFILGVFVTSWRSDEKQRIGVAELYKGRRTAGQVVANAGAAATIGLLTATCPALHLNAPLLIAACFAAATADTVSSELGNVYGHRFYNILNLKKSEKGPNGVVSIEGTLLGIAGSIIIAFIYSLTYGWNIHALIIVIAGTAGNIADSVLGAAFEEKGYLSNNMVNFLNTSIAAFIAWLLHQALHITS